MTVNSAPFAIPIYEKLGFNVNDVEHIVCIQRHRCTRNAAFPLFSPWFWILYCWCGISDMIDGPIARKIGTESELGSRIDSLADLIFVICFAMMILSSIKLPIWIWLWTASIGMVKPAGIVVISFRRRRFRIPHSISNKLTGILLFCLPFALIRFEDLIPSVIVCAIATLSLYEDILFFRTDE